MAAPRFQPLRVSEVRRETPYAVVVGLDVPEALRDAFRFTQGQFLTFRRVLDGEELRRSYSICAPADGAALRVAVKRVDGGRFSVWANDALRRGDTLETMPPDGKFHVPLDPANRKHHVAFAAGSGITPVLSLIATTLAVEPLSRFTLVYGNRFVSSIMFCEALEDLKDRFLGRFTLYHVLSRDHQEIALFNGRIDAAKCAHLLETLIPAAGIDEAFICGPPGMAEEIGAALERAGVARARIHVERFVAQGEAPAPRSGGPVQIASGPGAEVTVIVDGQRRAVFVPHEGESILDMALHAGADLPFACKSGVCSTCRAKLVSGEVRMDRNFALDDADVARGFVLSCQAHPLTAKVVLNYDER